MRTWKHLLTKKRRRSGKSAAKFGCRSLRMEGLEERRLMSADPVISFKNGILKIDVDDGKAVEVRQNDVALNNGNITAQMQSALSSLLSNVEVRVDGKVQKVFPLALVKEIQFTGSDHNDRFTNNTDIDSTARGYGGNDEFIGGTGTDRFYGGAGRDTLLGNQGDDFLYGGTQDDVLDGGAGNDVLYGNEGSDILYGRSGSDSLIGGDQKDWLYGGSGTDWLLGEGGTDILVGSGGNDVFCDPSPAETASWDRALGELVMPFVRNGFWEDLTPGNARGPCDIEIFQSTTGFDADPGSLGGGIKITADLQLDPTGQTSNGLIVFDYVDNNNYKLAGIDAGNNRHCLMFAEVVNGKYRDVGPVQYDASITATRKFHLELEVTADNVTVKIPGQELAVNRNSFANSGNLLDGKVGVGTSRAIATFDNITVSARQ